MVLHTRTIRHTTTTDHNDTVLLDIVSYTQTRDISLSRSIPLSPSILILLTPNPQPEPRNNEWRKVISPSPGI